LQEECRGWDINEAVFSPGMWEMYQPMLRADFKLFDEYIPSNTQQAAVAAPFASRLRLFWGQSDMRVTEAMVKVGIGIFSFGSILRVRPS
jgi:surfactin synthase thioesterase subunit